MTPHLSLRVALSVTVLALVTTACSDDAPASTTIVPDTAGATTTALSTNASSTTTTSVPATQPTGTTSTTLGTILTTTTMPPTTTTIAAGEPSGNRAPTISISRPRDKSYHTASFDPGSGTFGALITFEATASDPDGDPITIEWSSSVDGPLGVGASITVFHTTGGTDSSQPFVTARARDKWGRVGEDQIQIIVVVPSDT